MGNPENSIINGGFFIGNPENSVINMEVSSWEIIYKWRFQTGKSPVNGGF